MDNQIVPRSVDEPVPASSKAPTIYTITVISFGAAVIMCVVGAVALAVIGRPVPEVLTALGAGSVGALGGLLAPSPVR